VHAEVGEDATLLLMPASSQAGTGVKLVTVNPANPLRGAPLIHGLYVLFDPERLAPRMLVDGAALTGLRTAAVSGVATRHLAPANARRLVLFGAGTQAWAHLDAMQAVRPVEQVTVVSRSAEPAERLAARAREHGLDADIGGPDAVAEADLVCTCTTSPAPVFDGALLPDGAHVNAVGAFTPDTRELDDEAVRRGRLVVERREAALEEAGDLLIPLRAGVIDEQRIVADLFAVCRGEAQVRRDEGDVTVFKSVGLALEDLAVVTALADRL
jgi:ornithine cyclodeaminase/alanine dehydrogenase-like protein (mu-crystallin family)